MLLAAAGQLFLQTKKIYVQCTAMRGLRRRFALFRYSAQAPEKCKTPTSSSHRSAYYTENLTMLLEDSTFFATIEILRCERSFRRFFLAAAEWKLQEQHLKEKILDPEECALQEQCLQENVLRIKWPIGWQNSLPCTVWFFSPEKSPKSRCVKMRIKWPIGS